MLAATAAVALAATPALAAGDANAGLQAMRELNLIVLGNMTGGHDVEGKAYVGGTLSGSSTTVGIGNGAQGAAASSRSTLTVGNQLTANVNLNNGSNGGSGNVATNFGVSVFGNAADFNLNATNATVLVGGSVNNLKINTNGVAQIGGNLGQTDLGQNSFVGVGGNASNINGATGATLKAGGSLGGYVNANGATITGGAGVGFNAANLTSLGGLAAATTTLADNLKALSQSLLGLNIAGNPSSFGVASNKLTINAVDSGAGFAVVNLNASDLGASELDYSFAAGVYPLIVNVTGVGATTLNWLMNPVGGDTSAINQRVIWNFADATGDINFQRMFHGSVLAPFATISNNTPIEGSVAVAGFHQGGEVHLGTYNGPDFETPPTIPGVPEPASWALMIMGVSGLGGLLRRRTAVAAGA